MTEPNIEIVRTALQAFNYGDFGQVHAVLHPEVEVHTPADMQNPGTFTGIDGYTTWLGRWMEAWESFTVEEIDSEAIGDHCVVSRIRQHGRGRGSGIETSMEAAYFWEVRDGKVSRLHIYHERAQALAAAGGG